MKKRLRLETEDLVSIHWESTHHLRQAIKAIRQRDGRLMVVLNPDTPLSVMLKRLDRA